MLAKSLENQSLLVADNFSASKTIGKIYVFDRNQDSKFPQNHFYGLARDWFVPPP